MATRSTTFAFFSALTAASAISGGRAHADALTPPSHDVTSSEGGNGPGEQRIEWLVGSADIAYRALDLRRIEFDDSDAVFGRAIPATANGISPGLGLGLRLWFVSLMLHGDVTFFNANSPVLDDSLQLWSLDLEALLRMAQGRFQPYVLIGGGYSSLGGIDDLLDNVQRAADAHGANIRLGLGFDYYLTRVLTFGVRANADGLLLASRVSALDLAEPQKVDTVGETKARLREADGSIGGFCYAAGLTFGAHYL